MEQVIIFAYQLQPTDCVSWYGVYCPILSLKGTYRRDIGLSVNVTCILGNCVVPYNLKIDVLRTYE